MKKYIKCFIFATLTVFLLMTVVPTGEMAGEPSATFARLEGEVETFPKFNAIIENVTYFDVAPENVSLTPEGYLNTTNPYGDAVTVQNALDEVDDAEGAYPIYVLVFADEEERTWWDDRGLDWREYAIVQLERGDEALVANFGIDIRIIDLISFDNLWKSDDNLETMPDIFDDLVSETYIFLGCHYTGAYWTAYVDAIVGITRQETNDGVAGVASGDDMKDQGQFYILLSWQSYWADDNVVQHEFAHLFYADDHWNPDAPCCAMTQSHAHYVNILWEDGQPYPIYGYVLCAYLRYSWCTNCQNVINLYRNLFCDSPHKLVVRYDNPYSPKGTLSHLGVYGYANPTTVSVSASNTDGWIFSKWELDAAENITSNPVEVTVNKRHTLTAYYEEGYKLTITIIGEGSTNPPQGEYWFKKGTVVTVYASEGLQYWTLDGTQYTANPITVTMNRAHSLNAYFAEQQTPPPQPPPSPPRKRRGGGGGGRWCLLM